MSNPNNLKIAVIDIENSPSLGYVWERWNTNVVAMEAEWFMMSWAAKWLGEKKGEAMILPDYSLYKKEPENDRELIKSLWKWFDEADIIIGHNLWDFDRRKANARFIVHGLPPPRPYKVIDTLKIARGQFQFTSNKLDDLADMLGCTRKLETGGIKLWLECMNGDLKAWQKLRKYNLGDIFTTEEVYMAIRAWDDRHPNVTLADAKNLQCPVCGGKTERRGFRYMKSYKAQSFHCLNKSCGRWSTGKREKIQAVVLS